MCSLTETFDYYCTEICDLLLSLFLLRSIDYYVYLDVLCSSMYVLFVSARV